MERGVCRRNGVTMTGCYGSPAILPRCICIKQKWLEKVIMKNFIPFILVIVCAGICSEPWYPFRLEYKHNGYGALGLSSGVWWSFHEDIIPTDAYGPIFGINALIKEQKTIPGLHAGLEANMKYVCARIQCEGYRVKGNDYLLLFTPQAGFTWFSIANIYLGYSMMIAGTNGSHINNFTIALCINLPSYVFKE